jgi:hypothetical protein
MEKFNIEEAEADLIAPRFAVLIAEGRCWKCSEATSMAGIWVPSYTSLDHEHGEHDTEVDAALLRYVTGLKFEVREQVVRIAPWLRYAHTDGAATTYLANHCEHCDVVQGDWFVFGVDGPFFPQTEEETSRVRFVPGQGSFHGCADPAVSSWMGKLGP